MKPEEIFELFSVDATAAGARDLLELAYLLALDRLLNGDKVQPFAQSVRQLCKIKGLTPRMYYGRMKRAARPILEADEDALAMLGLHLPKRNSSALAVAMAAQILKEGGEFTDSGL